MNALEQLKTFARRKEQMYKDMAKVYPHVVHCKTCGREEEIDPAWCLQHGWPTCCENHTMRLGRLER